LKEAELKNMEKPQVPSQDEFGQIHYPSASPFEIHHILCKLDEAPEHPVFGSLLVPENPSEDPMPCVIAVHGSLNWGGHHHEHITNWLESGFCVFRVHSFDSRKVYSVVEDQMQVTYAMMLADCYQALRMLSTHPSIDSSRIALAGWSLGGTVALYGAWNPIAEQLAPDGERFAAFLSFYPAAHLRPEVQRWSNNPILVLHGSEDDWVPVKLVKDLIEEITPHGVNINLHVYEGAHHSFDSVEPFGFLPHAISLDDHRTVTIGKDGEMWGEIQPGVSMPLNEPADRIAVFQAIGNLGVNKGVDWAARKHSFEFATNFLQESLS
jgi:dienelactone hydrolase